LLANATRNINYGGGSTNLHSALKLARTEIFNVDNGDRAHVQNVLILVIDGEPTHYTDENGQARNDRISSYSKAQRMARDEVNRIKNASTRIIAVGVGKYVSGGFQWL